MNRALLSSKLTSRLSMEMVVKKFKGMEERKSMSAKV